MRNLFIRINEAFIALLGDSAHVVHVGSAENAGDGETVHSALAKILANLEALKAKQ